MIRKIKNLTHLAESKLANVLQGYPSRNLKIIGVTGTDGKTTTATLIHHIIIESGKNASLVTSLGAKIGDKTYDTGFHTTTPSSFSLQKYIKKALNAGSESIVLEVTSHALDQNRVGGIIYEIGVLTNITHEHLDYHRTYENYVKTKSKLLKRSKISIINMDDQSFEHVLKEILGKKVLTYSRKNKKADFNLDNINIDLQKVDDINKHNFLAAIACAKIIGIKDEIIKGAIKSFVLPEGRQEVLYNKKFKVVLDFAHTPNSFEKVLPGIKKTTSGRLIHVFGVAGERDATKRPLMGQASAKYADIIILTAEDPRSERIEDINEQIKLGIKKYKGELLEIPDRQEAINKAVRIAQKGDVVIITGKGHEKSMNLGNGEIPWSEHAAVEKALELVNRE